MTVVCTNPQKSSADLQEINQLGFPPGVATITANPQQNGRLEVIQMSGLSQFADPDGFSGVDSDGTRLPSGHGGIARNNKDLIVCNDVANRELIVKEDGGKLDVSHKY